MFKVLDLKKEEDQQIYTSLTNVVGLKSAYNRLEYFEIFCGGFDNLVCFLFEESDKIIFLPGYLKKNIINGVIKDTFDFSTPYGYTGPFYNSNIDESALKTFWNLLSDWFLENNVVSEFIRFNLFNNAQNYNGDLRKTMLNIKGEIVSEEQQWGNFDAKVRKNVKRAQREKLTSVIFYNNITKENIREFHEIYIDTMERTNASEFFFYSLDAFSSFILNNQDLCAICTIYDKDKAISTELLLLSNNSVFSFLGGTLAHSFDKRPNDFLKFEVINWARVSNFEYYVLGGGYGYEDGIFKYKKAFFPNDVVVYNTGRKIVNKKLYKEYVDEVNSMRVESEKLDYNDDSFFPLYNKQN